MSLEALPFSCVGFQMMRGGNTMRIEVDRKEDSGSGGMFVYVLELAQVSTVNRISLWNNASEFVQIVGLDQHKLQAWIDACSGTTRLKTLFRDNNLSSPNTIDYVISCFGSELLFSGVHTVAEFVDALPCLVPWKQVDHPHRPNPFRQWDLVVLSGAQNKQLSAVAILCKPNYDRFLHHNCDVGVYRVELYGAIPPTSSALVKTTETAAAQTASVTAATDEKH